MVCQVAAVSVVRYSMMVDGPVNVELGGNAKAKVNATVPDAAKAFVDGPAASPTLSSSWSCQLRPASVPPATGDLRAGLAARVALGDTWDVHLEHCRISIVSSPEVCRSIRICRSERLPMRCYWAVHKTAMLCCGSRLMMAGGPIPDAPSWLR
jgi:hypothetical protein